MKVCSNPTISLSTRLMATGSSLFKWGFFLLLAVGVMLPSDGGHGVLSPKSLSFILAVVTWFIYLLFHPNIKPSTQRLLLFMMVSIMTLLIWLLVGSGNEKHAFDQFKIFVITIVFTSMAIYIVQEKCISFGAFAKFAIYANALYSFIKVTIASLHLLNIFNMIKVMEFLGVRYMSMHIMGDLSRLQTSVDILTPYLLFFALTASFWGIALNPRFKKFYVVLSWISCALSFSRFLLFCALMAHLASWLTLNKKELLVSLTKALLIVMAIVALAGPDRLYTVIERRFFSEDNSRSDEVREHQIREMLLVYKEAPYLGQGLGGHAPKALRDETNKYSYEVQWVSFLMQFGVFGITLLLLPLLFIYYHMFKGPFSPSKAALMIMFTLWLLSGFTNPFLISLASGIVYALFYGAAIYELQIKPQNRVT